MNCWIHRFGKWVITEEGELSRKIEGEERRTGTYLTQARTCEKCGFIEINKQKAR